MKILACFKVLPDPERIVDSDYENFSIFNDLSYAGLEFNCFDKSAFETALKLKDQAAVQGAEATCAALTVSEGFSDSMAEILYSSGFDQVISVKGSGIEFNPEHTADILAEAVRDIKPDIILTGSEAGYAETGMVPYYLSEKTGIPLVPGVETAQLEGKTVALKYRGPEGFCDRKTKMPVNICIGNSPETLRVPNLRDRLSCRGKTAEIREYNIKHKEEIEPSYSRPNAVRDCEKLEFNSKTIERILSLLANAKRKEEKEDILYPEKTVYIEPEGEYIYGKSICSKAFMDNDLILLPDTETGRKLAVYLSEKNNIPCLFKGEYKGIRNGKIMVSKRVMASNLEATYEFTSPAILTVENGRPKKVDELKILLSEKEPDWIIYDLILRPPEQELLENAETVVICGGGVNRKDTAKKARELANKLGAGFGLTRVAVMDGFGNPDEIIGQSGHILNPGCVIVLGAAGAGAFSVGIEKAGKIIAVNTNKNALIFKKSDYGIQMDAEAVINGLLEALN